MGHRSRSKTSIPFEVMENIVGCRISHCWTEANEPVTQWKSIILDQLPTNPSLYLLKYYGIDCVYGLELQSDERILNLKILPINVQFLGNRHSSLKHHNRQSSATYIHGHNGSKDDWKGIVLEEVPIMKTWFYITYKKDLVLYIYYLLEDYFEANLQIIPGSKGEWSVVVPEEVQTLMTSFYIIYEKDPFLYLYLHLDDYMEANLNIMPEFPPVEVTMELGRDSLAGKSVQYNTKDGTQEIGKIIDQVPTNPSMYFIKFDNDFHIYVYDLVKIC